MSRIRRVLLFMVFAACLVVVCMLGLSAASNAHIGTDRFLTSGGDKLPVTADGVTFSLEQNDSTETFSSVFSASNKTEDNAIRFVLANESGATHMTVRITYATASGNATETQRIEIAPYSVPGLYLFRSENVAEMLSISLSFSPTTEGDVTLHAMETTRVYNDGVEANGTVTECVYRETEKVVTVKGSIYHDVMIHAGGGALVLFRMKPGQTLAELLEDPDAEAVASVTPSISFELRAPAPDLSSRFAAYAVVLCMPDGTRLPIADEKYSTVQAASSAEKTSDRPYFKGLDTTMIANAMDVNAGSAVVDVYLNRLENAQHKGYLYTVSDHYFYFDRAYIAQLDAQVRSLSGASCHVYLRLLSESGDEENIPCVGRVSVGGQAGTTYLHADNEEALLYLYAYTSFLCSRYQSGEKGSVTGLIFDSSAGAVAGQKLDERVRSYGRALSVIANTVRAISPEMMLVVPVSENWLYPSAAEGCYASAQFLESLSLYLTEHSAVNYYVMLESRHNPYRINDNFFKLLDLPGGLGAAGGQKLLDRAADMGSEYVCSDNITVLNSFLSYYAKKYDVLSEQYLFYWMPESGTTGDALAACYVLHYYSLFGDSSALAFVASFREDEVENNRMELAKIKYIVKYIDTSEGAKRTASILTRLGLSSWGELIWGFNAENMVQMLLTEGILSDNMGSSIKGSYKLFDFSAANSSKGWYAGNRCDALSVTVSDKYGKTLDASMRADLSEGDEYADISYVFAYPESLENTPLMSLLLAVDCDDAPDAVFEVKLVIGSPSGYIEARNTVAAGNMKFLTMVMDVSDYIGEITYMRLSVKPVMGGVRNFMLHLREVSMDSRNFDSQTLSEKIEARHMATQENIRPAAEEKPRYTMAVILAVVVLAATALAVAAVGHYQKREP